MTTLSFSLHVVSPLFIAGGNETKDRVGDLTISRMDIQTEGLRTPSLRGVLRFWFRAMHNGMDLSELKHQEATLFGATDYGQGVRIIPQGGSNIQIGEITASQREGLGYLGYGPLLYSRDDRRFRSHHFTVNSKRRDAILPGAMFNFMARGDRLQIDQLKKVLGLLHLFGGLGSRSRRGWGSVAVQLDGKNYFQSPPPPGNDLNEWFKQCFQSLKVPLPAVKSTYSAFSSQSEFYIKNARKDNYREVLSVFHKTFKEVRIWSTDRNIPSPEIAKQDYTREKRHAQNDVDADLPKRMFYGLPFMPKGKTWPKVEYQGYISEAGKESEIARRSSPLFLKVFEVAKDQLYPVCLFLPAHFFGQKNVKIGKKYGKSRVAFAEDWYAIQEFITEFNK